MDICAQSVSGVRKKPGNKNKSAHDARDDNKHVTFAAVLCFAINFVLHPPGVKGKFECVKRGGFAIHAISAAQCNREIAGSRKK